MTVFDIEDKEAWFEMDGGGLVQLRTISDADRAEINKQTVQKKVDYARVGGKAERFEYEQVNEDLLHELTWDKVIVSWENLFDSKQREIQCTKENKLLLMSRSEKFQKFILESLKALQKDEEEEAKKSEKN